MAVMVRELRFADAHFPFTAMTGKSTNAAVVEQALPIELLRILNEPVPFVGLH